MKTMIFTAALLSLSLTSFAQDTMTVDNSKIFNLADKVLTAESFHGVSSNGLPCFARVRKMQVGPDTRAIDVRLFEGYEMTPTYNQENAMVTSKVTPTYRGRTFKKSGFFTIEQVTPILTPLVSGTRYEWLTVGSAQAGTKTLQIKTTLVGKKSDGVPVVLQNLTNCTVAQ